MSLTARHVARALGGEAVGRTAALVPGPGHGRKDRSLSIKLDAHAPNGFLVNSFCGDDWKECRDYVAEKLGLDKTEPRRCPVTGGTRRPGIVLPPEINNLVRARHLWACRQTLGGSPAETYLREARGYNGTLPATLGFLTPSAYAHLAMISAFGVTDETEPGVLTIHDEDVRGIHLTFLDPDGSGKAGTERDKIMIGPSSGWPIVVAPPNDLLGLVVTEGIEDALTVHQATGLGAWAAGSAGRMLALASIVPSYIETVTIYAHPDEAGQRGATGLADALLLRGLEVLLEGIAR
jgi:hypothetical protein